MCLLNAEALGAETKQRFPQWPNVASYHSGTAIKKKPEDVVSEDGGPSDTSMRDF